MRKTKLLWDFRGPESKGIAEHHAIHLREFAERERLIPFETGVDTVSSVYSIAFIVVEEVNMKLVRDALRPHRGEVAE